MNIKIANINRCSVLKQQTLKIFYQIIEVIGQFILKNG